MVAALVLSVISFQLNATMFGPAIRDIDTELGPDAFAAMANYFYLSGAIANVVFIRWSDYAGRKRVLLGIMIVLCIGTVLCVVSTSLPVVVLGRFLQGGCNVTFGLAFLILRERMSGPAFGVCCGVIASINGGVGGVDALIGGFMVDRYGYRSIFVLILVVGLAAIGLAAKAVPADDPDHVAPGPDGLGGCSTDRDGGRGARPVPVAGRASGLGLTRRAGVHRRRDRRPGGVRRG